MIAILLEIGEEEKNGKTGIHIRFRTHGIQTATDDVMRVATAYRDGIIIIQDTLMELSGKSVAMQADNRALTAEELAGIREQYFFK